MKKLNSKGLGIALGLVVIGLIGILVIAGYRINSTRKNNIASDSNTTQTITQPINSSKDVESATNELETVDLEIELDVMEFDADINAVL